MYLVSFFRFPFCGRRAPCYKPTCLILASTYNFSFHRFNAPPFFPFFLHSTLYVEGKLDVLVSKLLELISFILLLPKFFYIGMRNNGKKKKIKIKGR